jgi:hypothetical protein
VLEEPFATVEKASMGWSPKDREPAVWEEIARRTRGVVRMARRRVVRCEIRGKPGRKKNTPRTHSCMVVREETTAVREHQAA